MCRNIRPLFNFEPAATDDEITAAAIQYVRKVSGLSSISTVNQPAFDVAVDKIALATTELFAMLSTSAAPKNREIEAAKARERSLRRFGS